jgi:hypothetical protein
LTITEEVIVGSYHVRGNYDYKSDLDLNLITDNNVSPDYTLYSQTTNQINFNFSYGFVSYPEPSNITQENIVLFLIESDKNWNQTLNGENIQDLFFLNNENNGFTFRVIPNTIINYVDNKDEEFGVATESFSIKIIPQINTRTIMGGVYVNNSFEPTLKIRFDELSESGSNNEMGKQITIIEDFKNTEAFPVTRVDNLDNQNLAKLRIFSLLLLIMITIAVYKNRGLVLTNIKSIIEKRELHKNRILKINNQLNDWQNFMEFSLDELVESGRYSDKRFKVFYVKDDKKIHEYVYSFKIINGKNPTQNSHPPISTPHINEPKLITE